MRALIENSVKTRKTELTASGKVLGEVNINRGVFQRDSLSPILFTLALVSLTLILRKMKAGYNLGEGKGNINHLLYMDDLKLYGKNQYQIDRLVPTVRIFSTDICMDFGISKCTTLTMK